jgi:hypothetical protein
MSMADEKTFEDRVREVEFDNAQGRKLTGEDLASVQPGLARLMPEVGARVWKLYYAAQAKNWPLAKFQLKEAKKLMELGALTRPKYEENLGKFIDEQVKPMMAALEAENLEKFNEEFQKAVEQANAYHELYDKPFLRWKVPSQPPPDLDLTPRPKAK